MQTLVGCLPVNSFGFVDVLCCVVDVLLLGLPLSCRLFWVEVLACRCLAVCLPLSWVEGLAYHCLAVC